MYRFLILILLIGCCRFSPTDPILPPIQHKAVTFEEHIARLQTPGHVYFWIKNFTVYDGGTKYIYNQNWYTWEDKRDNSGKLFPDQAYAVAYEVYNNYVSRENRGVCGQFACTYVVACRAHGYKCGVILTFSKSSAHAEGWIQERDGRISITSNLTYTANVYGNWNDFLRDCRQQAAYCKKLNLQENINAYSFKLCNDVVEIVLDELGEYWDNPKQL